MTQIFPPRPASNVVPFPGSARIAQNESRLAAARAILRDGGRHDTFTVLMACNTLIELGSPTDRELADLIVAQTTAHIMRPPLQATARPAPPARTAHLHPVARLACAAATALLVLLILYDTPARLAATLLQAEQMKDW
jgi:acyl-CoA synthetase (AMP-forming)/AMP-acid ligase II